jgi:hypothetical protein
MKYPVWQPFSPCLTNPLSSCNLGGWVGSGLDRIYEINFFEYKEHVQIFSKKMTTYICVIYATPKIAAPKFDLHLEIQKR